MKYVSKCKNLVLTVKPARSQVIDGIVLPVPGEHVKFENHEFETKDKKTIDFLKNHRLLGTAFTGSDIVNESPSGSNGAVV